MKRILALISVLAVIGLLIIPSSVALADQNFHTVSLPLSLTTEGALAGHTLRNGWVTRIHVNGPINYAIGSYILNGATSDTTYDICWEFEEYGWLPIYEYHFIQTDKNGNGNLHWEASPALVPIPPQHYFTREGGVHSRWDPSVHPCLRDLDHSWRGCCFRD